jgi:hypothetical protein
MNDFDVTTNSLKITHSGDVSRPQDGCKLTGYEKTIRKKPSRFYSTSYYIVLHDLICAPLSCFVRNLHKVSAHECHPYVSVEVCVIRGFRDNFDLKFLHLSLEVRSDSIGL